MHQTLEKSKQKRIKYKQEERRLRKILQGVAEIAVSVVPADERVDRYFSKEEKFNERIHQIFPAFQTPMTHRQWAYVVAEAHHATKHSRNSAGHIPIDSIAENAYALFIRHVLAFYVNTYGIAASIRQLNTWRADLHMDSQGACIAASICSEILDPTKTRKGFKESIVSACIRKLYEPAEVTAHINLSIKQAITVKKEAEANHPNASDLSTTDYDLELVNPTGKLHGQIKPNNLVPLIRDDIKELMAATVKELTEEEQQVLRMYLHPEFEDRLSTAKTFHSGVQMLKAEVGIGEHRLRKISKAIVNKFRQVMQMTVKRKPVGQGGILVIKDKDMRSRIKRGLVMKGYQNQAVTRIYNAEFDHCYSNNIGNSEIEDILEYVNAGNHMIENFQARLEVLEEVLNHS